MLSSYDVGDAYGPHHDESTSITANLFLCSAPRRFEGGDFFLGDDDAFSPKRRVTFRRIPFQSGRLVVFPCRSRHYVDEVRATGPLPFRDRRFSIQYWPMYARS